jgi:DNA-binding IclR family transcriptional regulator
MTAIAKALTILELAGREDSASLASLIEQTKLPRSTVVRIVGELLDRQYLERAERGRYRPGPTVRSLARASGSDDVATDRARKELRALMNATGETAHLAVYEDGSSVYVDKVDGSHPIRAYTKIGGRSPAYATATGKALLAWQEAAEIDRIAARATRYTTATHLGADAIRAEMKRVRRVGYAVNRGEWRDGVWGIAAPLLRADGSVLAAIGLSGPEQRIRPRIAGYAALVRDHAARISGAAVGGGRR